MGLQRLYQALLCLASLRIVGGGRGHFGDRSVRGLSHSCSIMHAASLALRGGQGSLHVDTIKAAALQQAESTLAGAVGQVQNVPECRSPATR